MPYRTLDDKIDGLVITFIEISKSKKLENELRSTQMMLNSIIQAMPQVIMGLSLDWKIIEFNPKAEELFGYAKEVVMGKNYIDFFVPEPLKNKVLKEMNELLSGEFPCRYMNSIKTIRGELVNMEWIPNKIVDKEGKTIGIITVGVSMLKIPEKAE
jgi:two-component system CheB/CheR fusion protein